MIEYRLDCNCSLLPLRHFCRLNIFATQTLMPTKQLASCVAKMFSWLKFGKNIQLAKVWQKCSVGKSVAKMTSENLCGKNVQLVKV